MRVSPSQERQRPTTPLRSSRHSYVANREAEKYRNVKARVSAVPRGPVTIVVSIGGEDAQSGEGYRHATHRRRPRWIARVVHELNGSSTRS